MFKSNILMWSLCFRPRVLHAVLLLLVVYLHHLLPYTKHRILINTYERLRSRSLTIDFV